MAGTLEAYHKKRNFAVTSEPEGKRVKAKSTGSSTGQELSFIIQKHAASRLHYDLRLELDGVLKSWAVTRGPSLVPGDKRLAVHVEDHPIEYGTFEGTIPAGEYGAGTVLLWDRGSWLPDGDPHRGFAKGHIEFELRGEKLHGRWHLVRMRGKPKEKAENWLLIKSDDEAARQAGDPDILEDMPRSVATQRTIEEIGTDKKSKTWHSNKAANTPAPIKESSPRKRAAAPVAPASEGPRRKKAAPAANKLTLDIPKTARKAAMPEFVAPQLATLAGEPPSGAPWLHEIKFDGYRMQGAVKNSKAILRTRKGLDWTGRFEPIARALAALPVDSALVDGEIVVEDGTGIADFGGLQKALKDGDGDALVYYVFDLLHLDGRDLTKLKLEERKALLEQIVKAAPEGSPLRYSEHFNENGDTMLKHICRLSAEGIVSKRRDAPYRSGRGTDWMKSKCANRQELVVMGFVPSTAASKAIGSLVLGYYRDGTLVHAGRAGTGFSNDLAKEMYRDLSKEKIDKSPAAKDMPAEARKNVVFVEPKRVAEVEFRGWTGGGLLRQASFKGLREDKDPTEIVREDVLTNSAPAKGARSPVVRARPAGVRLTHPDRVLWPEAGITKEGLADYYTMVWPKIEKHLVGRPLALVRCPTGIGHCFFQKHGWDGMSADIVPVKDPQDPEPLVSISSLEGLLGLVQASVLEIHPWGATANDLDRPDRLTMDLDPGDGVPWSALVAAAREVRDRLAHVGLQSFAKTTGGKGLHVVIPLTPSADWDDAKQFCRELAEAMASDAPDRYVATMAKKARTGRIYVDYLRNGRGATAVAAFSTRARASCGVSTPVSFDELDALGSGDHFTLDNLARRLEFLGADPWEDFFRVKQKLPSGAGVRSGRAGAKKVSARAPAAREIVARDTSVRRKPAPKKSASKAPAPKVAARKKAPAPSKAAPKKVAAKKSAQKRR